MSAVSPFSSAGGIVGAGADPEPRLSSATMTITEIDVATRTVSGSVRVESIATTLTSLVTEYIYEPSGSASSSQDVHSHSAQSLHTGMIIGITVSAVLAAGLCIAIVICYVRRKRRGEPYMGSSLLWRGTRHRSSVDSQSSFCSQPRASCLPTHEHAPFSQSAPRSKRDSVIVRSPIDAELERDDPDTSGSYRSGISGIPSSANATARSPDSDAPPFYTRCPFNLPSAHENLVHASFDGVAERYCGGNGVGGSVPAFNAPLEDHDARSETGSVPSSVPPPYSA